MSIAQITIAQMSIAQIAIAQIAIAPLVFTQKTRRKSAKISPFFASPRFAERKKFRLKVAERKKIFASPRGTGQIFAFAPRAPPIFGRINISGQEHTRLENLIISDK
jgi:hypothetical protein